MWFIFLKVIFEYFKIIFSWVGLVSKNYEIECAIVELEKELLDARKKSVIENMDVMTIGATTTIEETENDSDNLQNSNKTENNNIESKSDSGNEMISSEQKEADDVNMEENRNE